MLELALIAFGVLLIWQGLANGVQAYSVEMRILCLLSFVCGSVAIWSAIS